MYDPDKHHRRSIRLTGYDYSRSGAYFVTVCTWEHVPFFADTAMCQIAEACWLAIPDHFSGVELDSWVVMPNHMHGIVVLPDESRGVHSDGSRGVHSDGSSRGVQLNAPTVRNPDNVFSSISPRRETLGVIVRTFKAAVTTQCRRAGHEEFRWQRNYYEHIIRDAADLARIRKYIAENPSRWEKDHDNPK